MAISAILPESLRVLELQGTLQTYSLFLPELRLRKEATRVAAGSERARSCPRVRAAMIVDMAAS